MLFFAFEVHLFVQACYICLHFFPCGCIQEAMKPKSWMFSKQWTWLTNNVHYFDYVNSMYAFHMFINHFKLYNLSQVVVRFQQENFTYCLKNCKCNRIIAQNL
jgi:hypothetical protein